MATYNKRGYKSPKEKEEKDPALDGAYIEDVNVEEKDSTTAGVFNTLDETANKTEAWVEKNQKAIFGIVGAIALVTIGYLAYHKFVAGPKEEDAAEAMFVAQQNFQKAVDGVKPDSLFVLALKGSEGQYGFVDIADKYSGTDAGNLANYYAGVSYLNTGKYNEAIESLDKFKSEDVVLAAMAIGLKGDAFSQKNQPKEALEYYEKAAAANKNEFTAPMYLLKAGKTALALNQKETALKHFQDIKDNYESSPEASQVDALIGLAQ
ncbi:tetratricopeptide repeat protein [Flavobacterium sp. MAH-1]|uniref:Tetratricopeptide repeat protein n=1 Tax=Flavobacterium agri TaxID=2743471 RepID=A0A7Y9C5H8_9FLAO|nr:tetratricopeptide repeat protein [Flavobacterium agri]NUY81001.1 tetratricopeptide repeat protein [Flavobacterium agri]NYA71025.1 tetratricopeptide repeat protein [Flavobacterium agri]